MAGEPSDGPSWLDSFTLREEPKGSLDPNPRYRVCDVCGQIYNSKRLNQYFHHHDGPHEPLLTGD